MPARQQFGHFVLDVVEDRHPEARFEVRCQREIERKIDRIEAALARYLAQVALLERRVARRERNLRATPSVGKCAARALARLGLERAPEFRVGVDFLLTLEVSCRDRREHAHALEDKRRLELEFEIQRTARDLRYYAQSLVAQFLRRLQR